MRVVAGRVSGMPHFQTDARYNAEKAKATKKKRAAYAASNTESTEHGQASNEHDKSAPGLEQAAPETEQAAPEAEQAAHEAEQAAPEAEQAAPEAGQAPPVDEQSPPEPKQPPPKSEQPASEPAQPGTSSRKPRTHKVPIPAEKFHSSTSSRPIHNDKPDKSPEENLEEQNEVVEQEQTQAPKI